MPRSAPTAAAAVAITPTPLSITTPHTFSSASRQSTCAVHIDFTIPVYHSSSDGEGQKGRFEH